MRMLIGVVVAVIVGVALIPLYVLLDLRAGGSGLGLCETGFGTCRTSYYAGLEVVAALLVLLLILVLAVGVLVKLLRYMSSAEGTKVPVQ